MKHFYLICGVAIVVVLTSCSKENNVAPMEIEHIDFDTVNFNHAIKGWELYSWPGDVDWNYALLNGSNRLKSYNEVMFSPYKVCGIKDLERMLSRLPKQEEIIWIEEEWLKQIWDEPYHNLQLPPNSIVDQVKSIGKNLDIHLWISSE